MQAHVRFRGIAAGLLLACTFATQAPAQEYPTRPLRLVTGAPGGANDFITRVIAQGLSAGLGQPAVVENKPSGVMEGEAVVNAKADGYTLLCTSANLWISGLMQKVPFDALRDFRPVTLATSAPYILVVHPQLPAKSVAELIALAKARPGELNYVSLAVGSSNHLAGELFKFLAGVNLTRVSYKGVPLAISDLVTGQVHVLFSAVQTVMPHVKAGKLRALAVTTAEPSALVPGLPPVSATVKGYDTAARLGVFVPAGTPAPIVERLNRVIVEHLKSTDARERLSNAAIEPVGTSAEELAALMKLDIARWEKVLRAAGLSVQRRQSPCLSCTAFAMAPTGATAVTCSSGSHKPGVPDHSLPFSGSGTTTAKVSPARQPKWQAPGLQAIDYRDSPLAELTDNHC